MGDSIGHKIGADQAEEIKEKTEDENAEQLDPGPETAPGEGIHPYDG